VKPRPEPDDEDGLWWNAADCLEAMVEQGRELNVTDAEASASRPSPAIDAL
jgi:hypothetical protein